MNIIYRVSEGARFRVGQVNIQGNTKTQDKVIRREIPLKPGQNFNSVDLETTRARLQNLQYFSDKPGVQVTGVPAKGGYRDVNVLVQEQKTGSFGVGVGFNSIESLVGFLNIEQSNFDIAHPWNFTGGGQRAAFNARLGSSTSDLSLSLTEPWFLDRQLAFGGEVFYHDSSYYSTYYTQKNIGGDLFLRRPLGSRGAVKLDYRIEQVQINLEDTVPAGSLYRTPYNEDGTFLRSAVGLSYQFDSRDSNSEPRMGHKIDIGATVAGTGLGGDVNTLNLSARGSKFWNLRWDTILSVSGELASVDSTKGDHVPVFERVFLGGAHTLRGYKFRDVGPRDTATDDAIGGNSLGYISMEYSVPVVDMVRLAAFYDTGFVNARSWNFSPGSLYSDAGFGIRVKLPISPMPLALDYAVPTTSPDSRADKGGQFNFYLNAQY